jgi:predicted peptidase
LIAWFGLSISLYAQPEASTARDRIQTRTYEFKDAGKEVEYTLFVPTSYDAEKPTPLIVLLHGLGSNPRQVIRYQGIADQAEEYGYIVVAPYGYNERGWYGSLGQDNQFARRFRRDQNAPFNEPENLGELSEKDVFNVLALIREEFTIDKDRIYLMGHSMGGGGTLYLGMKRADLWAGLAPMAPAIYSSPDQLEPVQHLSIIVVQGDQDRLVSVEIARRWVAKMKDLDMTHEYIEIKDGNHVTSITRNAEMIAKIFAFFNAHTRRDALEPAGAAAGEGL